MRILGFDEWRRWRMARACCGGDLAVAAVRGGLEEIVVTAQRREQNLQDVGISVTAFSADQVRNMGITNTTDVAQMTPNLNFTTPQAAGSQINFFLRGVGLNDFADAQENPVAVYVDDVYKPAMGGLSLQLFDVERIEVLRGPQGALFGRNSTGGVIHYVTKRPGEEFDAYADVSYGDYDQVKAEGAVGGQLKDGVMGRLSVAYDNHDGYTENRTPGVQDYNETDAIAGRVQLLVELSDTAEVLLSGNYSNNEAAVGAWQHQSTKVIDGGNTSVALAAGRGLLVRAPAPGLRRLRLRGHGRRSLGRRLRPPGPGRGDQPVAPGQRQLGHGRAATSRPSRPTRQRRAACSRRTRT